MKFWLIAEKWRLYTAGRRGKQGAAAIATAGPSGHCRATRPAWLAPFVPADPGPVNVDRR
jgi:hypothetical protein